MTRKLVGSLLFLNARTAGPADAGTWRQSPVASPQSGSALLPESGVRKSGRRARLIGWRLRSLVRALTALALLPCIGRPQELPPEVILLAHIKSHMREELSHLPNYTCLETIARFNKEADSGLVHESLKRLDTVRLEIVYSDHREWYGSPGESSLTADDPAGFVGSGLIGTGAFAIALNNILAGASFAYQGDVTLNGRPAVRYDFRFPRFPGGVAVSLVGGADTVGQKGSIWVDPKSLDLIRLESYADDIPPWLPLAEESTKVDYARTRIGDSAALLAQRAEMHLAETTGVESYDRFDFTHCRAFSARSTISFGDGQAEAGREIAQHSAAAQPPSAAGFVPALLTVTVQLAMPVTSADSVGQLIGGKVVGDVLRKGKIAIPNGASVKGRIRRLERFEGLASGGSGEFVVGLEFTEVEASSGPLPFYADVLRMDQIPGLKPALTERTVVHYQTGNQIRNETITLPELPGVASFFVSGSGFTIPAGFRTVWRTRGPIRGN